jgi:hypothetical protein
VPKTETGMASTSLPNDNARKLCPNDKAMQIMANTHLHHPTPTTKSSCLFSLHPWPIDTISVASINPRDAVVFTHMLYATWPDHGVPEDDDHRSAYGAVVACCTHQAAELQPIVE